MSFSSEVKEELSRHLPTARHCQIAETAAILSLCGQISEKDGTIRIQTENAYVARKYFTLLKKTFNIEAELAVKLNQKENTYLIRANDREETRQILQAVKLHETDRQLTMPIPAVVVQRQCCKRAFLRGAFLASGSGREEKPVVSSIYRISSIWRIAALTVLLMLAVSQFTFRLTLPRISFKIRTFSRFISAMLASMMPSISTICAPSFI